MHGFWFAVDAVAGRFSGRPVEKLPLPDLAWSGNGADYLIDLRAGVVCAHGQREGGWIFHRDREGSTKSYTTKSTEKIDGILSCSSIEQYKIDKQYIKRMCLW